MEENKLAIIINDSGLEKTKADFILEKFQDYFKIASEWEVKAKSIKVTNDEQKTDMDIARVGRLFLREKRISVEKARKEMKEQSLREGKAIDGIANVLKGLIEPIEDYLDQQENFTKYRLLAEEKEKSRLELIRLEQEEQERIEKEKLEQEKIRLENIILKKEAEEKEKQIQIEREKAEFEKKILEEKNRKEKEELDRIANEAKEKARKLEEENLKRKQEEIRILKEAEEKEKLLKAAPDKEKINKYFQDLKNFSKPIIQNSELLKTFNLFERDFNVLILKYIDII